MRHGCPCCARSTRGRFTAPGYLDKSRWNSVAVDEVPFDEVLAFIDESYEEVLKGLTKRVREQLATSG